MAITLHWGTAQSADAEHADLSAGISASVIGFVTQDADPGDPSLGWHWVIEDWSYDADDDWPPPEPLVLGGGYVASCRAGRTAVMDWVRQQAVAQLTLHN